jgi:hypothetical protein
MRQRPLEELLQDPLILSVLLASPRRMNKTLLPAKTLPGLKRLALHQARPLQDLVLLKLLFSPRVENRPAQPQVKKSLILDRSPNQQLLLYPGEWAQLGVAQTHSQHRISR